MSIRSQGLPGGVTLIFDFPSRLNWAKQQVIWGEEERLLNMILKAVGVTGPIFMTYAVPKVPSGSAPSVEELAEGRQHLLAELQKSQPQKILCLGQYARAVLKGTPPSSDERVDKIYGLSEMVDIPGLGPIYTMTTIPLYYLSSTPDRFRDFAYTVGRWASRSRPVQQTPFKIHLIGSQEDFNKCTSLGTELHRATTLSVDVETTGLNPQTDQLLSVGIGIRSGEEAIAYILTAECLAEAQMRDALHDFLAGPKRHVRVVMHNAKFDLKFLKVYTGRSFHGIWLEDTILMSYVVDERPIHSSPSPHGLKTLSRVRYDVPNYAFDWDSFYTRLRSQSLLSSDWGLFYTYLATDLVNTLRLFYDLEREIKDESPDLWSMYRRLLIPGTLALTEIEMGGIMIDRPYLENLKGEITTQLDQIIEETKTLTLELIPDNLEASLKLKEKLNLNSPLQVKSLIYDTLGIQPLSQKDLPHKASSTRPTDKDSLQELIRQLRLLGHDHRAQIVANVIKYREYSKLWSTYVSGLLDQADETDRVHGEFNLHGTATGRLSCSSPNLQNIPTVTGPIIRRAFIAPPGFVFAECDYSQLELRIAALYSQDPIMIKAYQNNRDIHTEVASAAFQVPYDQVSKSQRYAAKYLDFGILYGRSAHSLANAPELVDYDWTVDQASAFIESFLGEFAQLKEWIAKVNHQSLTQQYVETLTGRRRRWPFLTQEIRNGMIRQSVNTPIQGLASDFTLFALIEIHSRLRGKKSRIVATVHDSICFEIATDELSEVSKMIRKVMLTHHPVRCNVPLSVDIEIGPSWGELSELPFESGISQT